MGGVTRDRKQSFRLSVAVGSRCVDFTCLLNSNSRKVDERKIHHFFELLERSSIPLLIYSAGITDIINEAIRQLLGRVPSNIAIAANVMCFNEDGYVYGFTNPPLHSLCKNITRLRELIPGVDQKYAKRTNVLVIGDTDSDASMVDGWKGKCVLKVGLEAEEKPTLKRFDVVIKGSDCSRLIDVVRFILSPQQL
ncbi:hypothetical protein Y032_0420g1145 [Ancylostoma ceylanicum]|uniref:5'-nucleotidase n=1 Tax=Ancylostoma ceylanicum TaxID=53326 RepID=A0A016X359_9BILA|nr:hypothetical protein Y032_0420g1145 [Ancylostoma ceylanicum]